MPRHPFPTCVNFFSLKILIVNLNRFQNPPAGERILKFTTHVKKELLSWESKGTPPNASLFFPENKAYVKGIIKGQWGLIAP